MNTKEKLGELVTEDFYDGPARPGKLCLVDALITKLPIKDLLVVKNALIDDNFKLVMKDGDLVNSIEEFFKFDLNVAETSRNSFLHRNTLLYRLDKILHLTGLNLKNFDDAVTFKIFMQVYRLTT